MIFLKMKRNLKLKGKRKKERKINMNSSGKRKVNWTPQILMAYYVVREKSRWRLNKTNRHEDCGMLCFANGTRWAMNTSRCIFFLQNLSDRAAKAEGGSKNTKR